MQLLNLGHDGEAAIHGKKVASDSLLIGDGEQFVAAVEFEVEDFFCAVTCNVFQRIFYVLVGGGHADLHRLGNGAVRIAGQAEAEGLVHPVAAFFFQSGCLWSFASGHGRLLSEKGAGIAKAR